MGYFLIIISMWFIGQSIYEKIQVSILEQQKTNKLLETIVNNTK